MIVDVPTPDISEHLRNVGLSSHTSSPNPSQWLRFQWIINDLNVVISYVFNPRVTDLSVVLEVGVTF